MGEQESDVALVAETHEPAEPLTRLRQMAADVVHEIAQRAAVAEAEVAKLRAALAGTLQVISGLRDEVSANRDAWERLGAAVAAQRDAVRAEVDRSRRIAAEVERVTGRDVA